MVEANHSPQEVALQARLAQATITLARQQAEKAVKGQLQLQGLKPQYIARRQIVSLAREHLSRHPELIAEAKPIVEQLAAGGFFGKRAALTGHIPCRTVISPAKQGEVSQ